MRENRREPRKKTKEWAKIVLTDERTVYNCTVIDISPQGASLKIGIAAVPDHFFLFRKTDQTLREATVKSRRYQAVGVELTAPLNLEEERPKAILNAIATARGSPHRRTINSQAPAR